MADDRMIWTYDSRSGTWSAPTRVGRYTARYSGYHFIAQLEGVTLGTGSDIGQVRALAEADHTERLAHTDQPTVVPTDRLLAAMREVVKLAGPGAIRERDATITTVNRLAKILGIDVTWEEAPE